ncbi:hypothetical protein Rhe02_65620 [Rhizocola hellebori]|uniref:Uncharacterized protein n=1 Tax=Rhizocola hellebori TaxID=1392758 RepID=A0A8J3QF81_9ACTN|nr:hypothetical protein Rhe02_65620 [Rhizocola hellebori]
MNALRCRLIVVHLQAGVEAAGECALQSTDGAAVVSDANRPAPMHGPVVIARDESQLTKLAVGLEML